MNENELKIICFTLYLNRQVTNWIAKLRREGAEMLNLLTLRRFNASKLSLPVLIPILKFLNYIHEVTNTAMGSWLLDRTTFRLSNAHTSTQSLFLLASKVEMT